MAVDYAKEREQFGRPIGAYQAVSHRLADMLWDVEEARSLTYYAAWCADAEPESLPLAASMAKARASDAACRGDPQRDPDLRRHRLHLGARRPLLAQARPGRGAAARHRRPAPRARRRARWPSPSVAAQCRTISTSEASFVSPPSVVLDVDRLVLAVAAEEARGTSPSSGPRVTCLLDDRPGEDDLAARGRPVVLAPRLLDAVDVDPDRLRRAARQARPAAGRVAALRDFGLARRSRQSALRTASNGPSLPASSCAPAHAAREGDEARRRPSRRCRPRRRAQQAAGRDLDPARDLLRRARSRATSCRASSGPWPCGSPSRARSSAAMRRVEVLERLALDLRAPCLTVSR